MARMDGSRSHETGVKLDLGPCVAAMRDRAAGQRHRLQRRRQFLRLVAPLLAIRHDADATRAHVGHDGLRSSRGRRGRVAVQGLSGGLRRVVGPHVVVATVGLHAGRAVLALRQESTRQPTPTRSPTWNLRHLGPTADTTPAISWPGTSGYMVVPNSLRARLTSV